MIRRKRVRRRRPKPIILQSGKNWAELRHPLWLAHVTFTGACAGRPAGYWQFFVSGCSPNSTAKEYIYTCQIGAGGAGRGGAGQAKPGSGPSGQQHCPQFETPRMRWRRPKPIILPSGKNWAELRHPGPPALAGPCDIHQSR